MTGQERKVVEEADHQVVASGFTQEIEEVIHRGPYRETIIDHISNNCPRKIAERGVTQSGELDHNIIWARVRSWELRIRSDQGLHPFVKYNSVRNDCS